jgi:hypothetical protein
VDRWPSRKVRDEGMKKVMTDPRVKPDVNQCRSTASAVWRLEPIVEACQFPVARLPGTAPKATRREWVGPAVIALCLVYAMDLTV